MEKPFIHFFLLQIENEWTEIAICGEISNIILCYDHFVNNG